MIIKNVNIEKFGKIKNLSIDFEENINIVHGQNESGKSTIENFIFTTLYGPVGSKKYNIDNTRTKYIPYNDNFTFGTMLINHNKNDIIIERKIGKTRKDDVFRSFYKENFSQAPYPDNIGREIFDLDYKGFIKTLFVSQENTKIYDEKDEGLISRLTNLVETGDEEVSFTKAINKIDNEIKNIKGARKNGLLDDIYIKSNELHIEYNKSKEMEKLQNIYIDKLETLNLDLKLNREKQKDIKDLKEKLYLHNIEDEFIRLSHQIEELTKLKNERLNGIKLISRDEFNKLRKTEKELLELNEKLNKSKDSILESKRYLEKLHIDKEDFIGFKEVSKEDIYKIISFEGEIALLKEKLREYDNTYTIDEKIFSEKKEIKKILGKYEKSLLALKNNITKYLFLGLSLIGIIIFFISPFKGNNISSYLFIAIYLILNYLISVKINNLYKDYNLKKSDTYEKKIIELADDIGVDYREIYKSKKAIDNITNVKEKDKIKNKLEKITTYKENIFLKTNTKTIENLIEKENKYINLNEKINKEGISIESKENEIISIRELIKVKKDSFIPYLKEIGFTEENEDYLSYLDKYELHLLRIDDIRVKEKALNYSIESLIGDRDKKDIQREIDKIKKLGLIEKYNKNEVENKDTELRDFEVKLLEEIKELENKLSRMDLRSSLSIEEEIILLKEEEKKLLKYLETLELTKDILTESHEKLSDNFITELNNKVSYNYNYITGIKRSIKVSEIFDMKYLENGKILEETYLSKGSLDQLYLSLRIAMSDIIFKGEKVVFVLDEPFVHYDKERVKNTLDLLYSKKDEYQFIIFTCHDREIDLLEKKGNIIYIN